MHIEYFPDGWTIVKFNDGQKLIYKIFATWRGGNERWRLSSGAKNFDNLTINGNVFIWPQNSGSVYHLPEDGENDCTPYQEDVLESIRIKCANDNVEFEIISLDVLRNNTSVISAS